MVRVVIVGGLVADAVLVWVGMGVADDVPRRAEAHEAESEVGMGARDGADGHARVASDIGGGIGWVRDGCRLLRVRAVPPPMCSSMESWELLCE